MQKSDENCGAGVVKGHRLRFVASGEEAQQAIDGIGAVIESGLGRRSG